MFSCNRQIDYNLMFIFNLEINQLKHFFTYIIIKPNNTKLKCNPVILNQAQYKYIIS